MMLLFQSVFSCSDIVADRLLFGLSVRSGFNGVMALDALAVAARSSGVSTLAARTAFPWVLLGHLFSWLVLVHWLLCRSVLCRS